MQIYCVGGAVRDQLLGLPVQDHDWVVTGATPQMLIDQGYTAVGRDFPVFLHPQTREEYALARTERKSGPGYRGFVVQFDPNVTLQDDLRRRDLTINAIARSADGQLIDPFGGQNDLGNKVLRHVSEAFPDDPVRILRLARFAARFVDFSIAPETMTLMRQMVAAGEADHLVPERVWRELSRGLMEQQPSRMFAVLRECGALAIVMPELDRLWGVPQRADYHPEVDTGVHVMMVIDYAAQAGFSLPVRFAALTHDLGKGTTPSDVLPRHIGHEARSVDLLEGLCDRLRLSGDIRALSRLVAREHGLIHKVFELRAGTLVQLLERLDVFRRPGRLNDILSACEADYRGRLGLSQRPYPQAQYLQDAARAAASVDAGQVAQSHPGQSQQIRALVHEARVRAVRDALSLRDHA